jgi:hypothetical protein
MLTTATKGGWHTNTRAIGRIDTDRPKKYGDPKVEHEGEEDDITTAWACFISRRV